MKFPTVYRRFNSLGDSEFFNKLLNAVDWPKKSYNDRRSTILSALLEGGDLGCTLQHLCEAAQTNIETVALIVWELQEATWIIDVGFDEAGIVWLVLWDRPDGGAWSSQGER